MRTICPAAVASSLACSADGTAGTGAAVGGLCILVRGLCVGCGLRSDKRTTATARKVRPILGSFVLRGSVVWAFVAVAGALRWAIARPCLGLGGRGAVAVDADAELPIFEALDGPFTVDRLARDKNFQNFTAICKKVLFNRQKMG